MVDEFQDTNLAQYAVARQIAERGRNIAVVGDADQSIYAWRNADIRNILSFQQDFPGAKVVRLSQNYRSTKTILEAAQRVIRRNDQRIDNPLHTDNPDGDPVYVADFLSDDEEAQFVVDEAQRLVRGGGVALRDCVVAYRINAQSRVLEEACIRAGVPYRLIGGIRFYQRKEIKDVVAYLRLAQASYDEVSLTRAINTPARGIGQKSVDDLFRWASAQNLPPWDALRLLAGDAAPGALLAPSDAPALPPPFAPRQQRQLAGFFRLIEGLRADAGAVPLAELIDEVLERSGYRKSLIESDDERDAEERFENLRELRGVAAEYDGPASETLPAFIESASLNSPQDDLDDGAQDYLTLITLHQIKGLEYPVVFIAGLEEGLLPHARAYYDDEELEEERRLFYVGMTRAEKRLYLLHAIRRRMRNTGGGGASRFLNEVPYRLTEPVGRGAARGRGGYSGGLFPDSGPWRREPAGATPGAAAAPDAEAPPFGAGDRVAHDAFGRGLVVSCAPRAGDYEVTVAFENGGGIRRLLHSYGKLQRVVS